jgi:acetyl esterase/lipase
VRQSRRAIFRKLSLMGAAGCLGLVGVLEFSEKRSAAEVMLLRDIEFARYGRQVLRMDLFRPRPFLGLPHPVLVWIHGGGWQRGSRKEGFRNLLFFARQGFLCASIDYRLSRDALFPAQIEDCKCAIRFLRAHARKLNLDPDRIGVWGASSGGHLAALLGTSGSRPELEGKGGWAAFSSQVQAVCDWFGPTDLLKMVDFPSQIDHNGPDSPEARLLGGPIQTRKAAAERANPIAYITEQAPPFLIMHADNDPLVPFNQSQLLLNALRKAKIEASLIAVHGGGHGGPLFNSPKTLEQVRTFFEKKLNRSLL